MELGTMIVRSNLNVGYEHWGSNSVHAANIITNYSEVARFFWNFIANLSSLQLYQDYL